MESACSPKKRSVTLSWEPSELSLEVNIEDLREEEGHVCDAIILEIEKYINEFDALKLIFKCRQPNDRAMKFVTAVLKMAERYQWAQQKDISLCWNFDLSQSKGMWQLERIQKYFDKDIGLEKPVTSGGRPADSMR